MKELITKQELREELKEKGVIKFVWKQIRLPFFVLGIIIKIKFFKRWPKEINTYKLTVMWYKKGQERK